ncbi:helix-turn-helix domain-containing protein [Planobispora longispora]|uniref:helix-turn-helix domain-containing protein n=1 Tax=Planobispora longispora TaxID=28887 RepID=UPI001945AD04|nr:helix-turn-helix transcriptional regulator [Planobispora longispora]
MVGFVTTTSANRPVGELLRQWRERRRMSQLDLSIQANISTRHLSFVETGRSKPSRSMILHLAEELDLPLRERNRLLLAGGFAPVYAETPLNSPEMISVREALGQVLSGHQPYPAVVVDQRWNLVDRNSATGLLLRGVAPELLEPPVNVLRLSLHPRGMAHRILNLGEWRAHLLHRLRRQISLTADPDLTELWRELDDYPCDQPEPEISPGPGQIVIPLRLRRGYRELVFFSTMTTFGHPMDITVAELAIEAYFPANPETAAYLQHQHHPD